MPPRKGNGDSLSCFAARALHDWRHSVHPISKVGRSRHRQEIIILANSAFLDAPNMLKIVRTALQAERRNSA